jgi:hypothetical protein
MNIFYPRPRSMVYLLDLVFVAVLISSQIQGVIGSLPRIADVPPDEQASAMKINAPTSAEITPLSINAMKKPCLLYYVEYGRHFNETAAGLDTLTDNPWVCELDAEDRVRNIIKQNRYRKSCVSHVHRFLLLNSSSSIRNPFL